MVPAVILQLSGWKLHVKAGRAGRAGSGKEPGFQVWGQRLDCLFLNWLLVTAGRVTLSLAAHHIRNQYGVLQSEGEVGQICLGMPVSTIRNS